MASHSFLLFMCEDQVVSTTRQEVDGRWPLKIFARILLLASCFSELLNSNKYDDFSVYFWHLRLALRLYNRKYPSKLCWRRQSKTLLVLGFLRLFLVWDAVLLCRSVFLSVSSVIFSWDLLKIFFVEGVCVCDEIW
jgi:hypothetical protein